MTIKTQTELVTDFPDNQLREITEGRLRDFVDSVIAVGGTMYVTGASIAVTTAWAPFTWFDNSIDTKGITEDFANGHFTIGTGAGGVYGVDVALAVTPPGAGWIEIAVTKNGALTPFRTKSTLASGVTGVSSIVASGTVVDGDTIGLAIRASANATVTGESAQFRAFRL